MNELTEIYFKESKQLIESIKKYLVKFFTEGDGPNLDKLLNGTHTLTGISLQIGYNKIAKLSEIMLNFFTKIEKNERKLTKEEFEKLNQAVNTLEKAVKSRENNQKFKKIEIT